MWLASVAYCLSVLPPPHHPQGVRGSLTKIKATSHDNVCDDEDDDVDDGDP